MFRSKKKLDEDGNNVKKRSSKNVSTKGLLGRKSSSTNLSSSAAHGNNTSSTPKQGQGPGQSSANTNTGNNGDISTNLLFNFNDHDDDEEEEFNNAFQKRSANTSNNRDNNNSKPNHHSNNPNKSNKGLGLSAFKPTLPPNTYGDANTNNASTNASNNKSEPNPNRSPLRFSRKAKDPNKSKSNLGLNLGLNIGLGNGNDGYGNSNSNSKSNNSFKGQKAARTPKTPKPPKIKKYTLRDPHDSNAVSELVTYIVPKKKLVHPMDPASFQLSSQSQSQSLENEISTITTKHLHFHNECLLALRVNKFEFMDQNGKPTTRSIFIQDATGPGTNINMNDAVNAHDDDNNNVTSSDLVSVSGGFRKNIGHSINPKSKNKLRYVCITRSTNARVGANGNASSANGNNTGASANPNVFGKHSSGGVMVNGVPLDDGHEYGFNDGDGIGNKHADYSSTEDESQDGDSSSDDGDDDDDDNGNDDYSLLYNPESELHKNGSALHVMDKTPSPSKRNIHKRSGQSARNRKSRQDVSPEKEQSSFPSLVFLAIHSDGSHPDVRQILDLDQLVAIESAAQNGMVKLVFQNGIIVELDCDLEDAVRGHGGPEGRVGGGGGAGENGQFLEKNRFLWSLLQIHAILCTSVVERNLRMANKAATTAGAAFSRVHAATALPQLTMRNVDRAELQYISTVNGFLSDNPILCALLERQRNLAVGMKKKNAASKHSTSSIRNRGAAGDTEEKTSSGEMDDEMDGIAYDMIMGNFTKLALFMSAEEKHDAEEVLNATTLQETKTLQTGGSLITIGTGNAADSAADVQEKGGEKLNIDEIDTAVTLTQLLQKRMRDLEAETCRRLIAWEDEKKHSVNGSAPVRRDTMEAQSLSNLFQTLDNLDKELEDMEDWLSDKAAAIKPLTDDCREVEEVNRELEQQQYSYELLSIELGRLLDGLDVNPDVEEILRNPSSRIVYRNGAVDIKRSEAGVEEIYHAGRELKKAFDKVEEEGGVHLRAVSERVEGLLMFSNQFCQSAAEISLAVMRQTIIEVTTNDDSKDDKNVSHTNIAKSIRAMQRSFQSSLLAYIKLIEILALLKPSMLPSVRDGYANLVSEGILSKKRLKSYFMALPGKSSVNMDMYTVDLSVYPQVTLRSSPTTDPNNPHMKPAQAKDVEMALSELLPVIAREAYFTAALFGLSAKHLSGREKKKNFESAKRSVDFSSKHFKYYIKRICGIASEADAEGKKVFADPLLSLISSILLNEAMDNYIDRQKKGGDHSLSLAYVRATILDLRKRVDKQWVSWIEEQIKWIQTSPGVPLNGKRAGVFTAFARFPSYLDHVMICCKAGRPMDHVPNLSRIKVITYYLQKLAAALFNSLHQCSERETTDQQYAANVMRMENSYFFTQTIKQRGPELTELFQKQITAASSICKQSTDAYLGFMIKREFKSLHTLFASISRIRREVGDADVPIHVPRSTFEKTLSKECNREILKEKIGAIYYRMEKHLSEAGGLLPVAWKALVKVLYEWFGRWEKLSSQCYKFSLEPSASDVVRIAKQAAGISAKKINEEKQKAIAAAQR